MTSKKLFIATILSTLMAVPCLGRNTARQLTPQQHQIVQKIENFLNGIRTIKAKFVQVNPDESTRNGTFSWLRPLHLKFDYVGNPKLKVFCDSDFFTQVDEDGSSSMSVSNSPASLLLKTHLDLKNDAHIVQVDEKNNLIMIELASLDDPQGMSITLVFQNNPFVLKQWKTKDATGNITDVVLIEPQHNVPMGEREFEVK